MNKVPQTNNKKVNKLIKDAYREGWRIKQNSGNHIKVYPPQGDIIVISCSGSIRSEKDVRSDFKRAGLEIK